MSTSDVIDNRLNGAIENFAAELTEAAFPVALRYGVMGSSVDLKLDLWRTLTEKVKRLPREVSVLRRRESNSCGAACQ
jgi:hypothetical protein